MLEHGKLIIATGGKVTGSFVEDFGVKMIAKTEVVLDNMLSSVFNIQSESLSLESINSQITYLSEKNNEEHLTNIIKNLGHNISHGNQVSILVSGIKESTILELVSNKNFKCSRLTTSKTISADKPLYVVNEYNKEFTEKFMLLREEYLKSLPFNPKGQEKANEFMLETKALSIVIHCELVYLYEYCHKKINNPYEYELKNVCEKILNEIKNEPLIKILNGGQ